MKVEEVRISVKVGKSKLDFSRLAWRSDSLAAKNFSNSIISCPLTFHSLRTHSFILIREMIDRFVGVHVEDGLADGQPVAVLEEEDGGGVAEVVDGGQAFHVAPLDGFE